MFQHITMHLVSAGIGIAAWEIIRRNREKQEYPYRWVCDLDDDCIFDLEANDLAFLDERVLTHKREEHNINV